jgi:hypothetical protein
MEKKEITIYHLHLYDDSIAKKDYYFGSISAIYEMFDVKEIGILASSLYNLKLDARYNPIYANNRCRIRKDVLITKTQSKK